MELLQPGASCSAEDCDDSIYGTWTWNEIDDHIPESSDSESEIDNQGDNSLSEELASWVNKFQAISVC